MKAALIPGIALLTACAGQNVNTDFFDAQSEFASQRELETTVVEAVDYEEACAHVTAVLMDLNCDLQEINSDLGIVSAYSSTRYVPPQGALQIGNLWKSCGGHRVTVSVTERAGGDIVVRASFSPPEPRADQAFKTLLRKSIALEQEGTP